MVKHKDTEYTNAIYLYLSLLMFMYCSIPNVGKPNTSFGIKLLKILYALVVVEPEDFFLILS